MLRTSWIHVFDHFDLYLTPVTLTFNLPNKCFKRHFSFTRATTVPNCFEIDALLYKLWYGQIRTHGRTHIHRTKIVTNMFRLPASGLDKQVDRRRVGDTILRNERRRTLLAQLGQLKTGPGGKRSVVPQRPNKVM